MPVIRRAAVRVCLWLLLSAALPVGATDATEQPDSVTYSDYQQRLNQPLTLNAAISEALQNNISLQIAQTQVQEREGEERHASRWVPANPELEVETGSRETPERDSTDFGIQFSQELWIGGQRGLAKAAAEREVSAARSRFEYLRLAITARTRRAFLDLLSAEQAVTTAQRLVTINKKFANYARQRLEGGEGTALDLNTATIGLNRAKSELADAQNIAERARLALSDVIARDAALPLQITGELRAWTLSLPDKYTLLQASAQQRQDLTAAAEAVEAARQELKLSRRQLIPNLTLFGFYREEENAEITGGGISLPLPLLHRYGGEQDIAGAQLRQRQLEADALQLDVKREVLTAVADYKAAASRVELLGGATLARAEDNVALVQKAFRAGKVGAPAITSAQDNLINVRRGYLAALNELIVAVTDLERASGGLIKVTTTHNADSSR